MSDKGMISDTGISLDSPDSILYALLVANLKALFASMSRQIDEDTLAVHKINTEKRSLESAYRRFRELLELSQPKEERLQITAAVLLSVRSKARADRDAYLEPSQLEDALDIPIDVGRLDLSNYPLWKIIREVLRHAGELRIVDLERICKVLGMKVRRQSIESALETHAEDFEVRKNDREKYVSLK